MSILARAFLFLYERQRERKRWKTGAQYCMVLVRISFHSLRFA